MALGDGGRILVKDRLPISSRIVRKMWEVDEPRFFEVVEFIHSQLFINSFSEAKTNEHKESYLG